MLVMVSNRTGIEVGLLAGAHPGRIGHLYSPGGERGPWHEIPYALDNGAWVAFDKGIEWSEARWRALLAWAVISGIMPLWALVPDVVANREATLLRWAMYAHVVRSKGFRPAFAAQDGMTFADVPDSECVIFLGGGHQVEVGGDRSLVCTVSGTRPRRPCKHLGAPREVLARRRYLDRRHRLVPQGRSSGPRSAQIPARDPREQGDHVIATVAKRFTFDAAHRLDRLPATHKCHRMHGHTYEVELVFLGDIDEMGFVIDYGDIAELWHPLHMKLDHRVLNDVHGLEIPSTEHLAWWIFANTYYTDGARGRWLSSVTVKESSTTWCKVSMMDAELSSGDGRLNRYLEPDTMRRIHAKGVAATMGGALPTPEGDQ